MEDIEKARAEYVTRLEAQMQHLQAEYGKYKEIAERWEPKVTVKTDTQTQTVTVGLQFGGKYVHATVPAAYLQQVDETSAVSTVTDALVESLVVEHIRKAVAPELARAQQGAKAVEGAGKW